MATEATNNGASTANPLPDATVKVENSDAPSQQPPSSAAAPASNPPPEKRWPGWPGDSVYRLIVPVAKVGSIIGKKGELIKRICEETKARIRILDGVQGTTDRIVLISGKEEPEAHLSPAMDAVLRVFKRINGLSETEGVGTDTSAAGGAACSIRLLVASSQAINLIGKQGSLIKSIQESSTASIRVLSRGVHFCRARFAAQKLKIHVPYMEESMYWERRGAGRDMNGMDITGVQGGRNKVLELLERQCSQCLTLFPFLLYKSQHILKVTSKRRLSCLHLFRETLVLHG